jgi:hypothetical protein
MKEKRKIKTISVPPTVWDEGKKLAAREDKSLSQFIVDFLVSMIKKNK